MPDLPFFFFFGDERTYRRGMTLKCGGSIKMLYSYCKVFTLQPPYITINCCIFCVCHPIIMCSMMSLHIDHSQTFPSSLVRTRYYISCVLRMLIILPATNSMHTVQQRGECFKDYPDGLGKRSIVRVYCK